MRAPMKTPAGERKIARGACPHDCPDTCAQALSDMGRGATFYDCLVEVEVSSRGA